MKLVPAKGFRPKKKTVSPGVYIKETDVVEYPPGLLSKYAKGITPGYFSKAVIEAQPMTAPVPEGLFNVDTGNAYHSDEITMTDIVGLKERFKGKHGSIMPAYGNTKGPGLRLFRAKAGDIVDLHGKELHQWWNSVERVYLSRLGWAPEDAPHSPGCDIVTGAHATNAIKALAGALVYYIRGVQGITDFSVKLYQHLAMQEVGGVMNAWIRPCTPITPAKTDWSVFVKAVVARAARKMGAAPFWEPKNVNLDPDVYIDEFLHPSTDDDVKKAITDSLKTVSLSEVVEKALNFNMLYGSSFVNKNGDVIPPHAVKVTKTPTKGDDTLEVELTMQPTKPVDHINLGLEVGEDSPGLKQKWHVSQEALAQANDPDAESQLISELASQVQKDIEGALVDELCKKGDYALVHTPVQGPASDVLVAGPAEAGPGLFPSDKLLGYHKPIVPDEVSMMLESPPCEMTYSESAFHKVYKDAYEKIVKAMGIPSHVLVVPSKT